MPMAIVRYVALVVAVLGIVMLIMGVGNSSTGYNILRWVHALVAVALIGVYEASLARTKRANQLSTQARSLSLTGRVSLTLALLIALVLLLSLITNLLTGGAYSFAAYIHVFFGLVGVTIAGVLFSRRYLTNV